MKGFLTLVNWIWKIILGSKNREEAKLVSIEGLQNRKDAKLTLIQGLVKRMDHKLDSICPSPMLEGPGLDSI